MAEDKVDISLDFDMAEVDFDLDGVDLDAFDFGLDTSQKKDDISDICVKRYPRPAQHFVKYKNAERFVDKFPEIESGIQINAIVSGVFIFGDFIEALFVKMNYFAEEMLVSTLSMGQENVDSFENLISGGFVQNMSLLVSDYWYAHERRKDGGVPYIIDVLGKYDGFKFAAAGVHTKIVLIKTSCGKHIVIHGSANLRSSRNIEQFTLEENHDLYEFHKEWISKTVDDFGVYKKSKRSMELWQAVQEEQVGERKD